MASAWIASRKTKSGDNRYRVLYRLGGRDSKQFYAGVFNTKIEAQIRCDWVRREIAAMRVPDIRSLAKSEERKQPGIFKMCPNCENMRMRLSFDVWFCVGCGYMVSDDR